MHTDLYDGCVVPMQKIYAKQDVNSGPSEAHEGWGSHQSDSEGRATFESVSA